MVVITLRGDLATSSPFRFYDASSSRDVMSVNDTVWFLTLDRGCQNVYTHHFFPLACRTSLKTYAQFLWVSTESNFSTWAVFLPSQSFCLWLASRSCKTNSSCKEGLLTSSCVWGRSGVHLEIITSLILWSFLEKLLLDKRQLIILEKFLGSLVILHA